MQSLNKKISVIIPVFRVEKYLEKCLDSIINQTYKNLEIILVDDGSDDNSGKICDAYACKDKRIVVLHKENEGLDKARKSGFTISTGDYIGYVDSDDWISPYMFETLLQDAVANDVDIVESGVIEVWSDYEREIPPYFEQGAYKGNAFDSEIAPSLLNTSEFSKFGITPYLCTKLFKCDVVEPYQMADDPVQDILNDNLVTYPSILKSRSLYIEKKCLYYYRINNMSLRHKIKKENLKLYMSIEESYNGRLLSLDDSINIKNQIKRATLHHFLTRIPFVFDGTEECLTPFGSIEMGSRIILYGAGSVGLHLKSYLNEKDIYVVKWVDSRYKNFVPEHYVESPQSILDVEYDYIIISVILYSAMLSIKNSLIKMGVPLDKIKWIKQEYIDNPDLLLQKAYNNSLYMEKKREN